MSRRTAGIVSAVATALDMAVSRQRGFVLPGGGGFVVPPDGISGGRPVDRTEWGLGEGAEGVAVHQDWLGKRAGLAIDDHHVRPSGAK